jgi:hypothetical protein
MIRISTFTLIGVTIMATTTVAAGQSQTPAPTDPTLAALQLQQQQLAAQQAALDARVKMQQDQQALLTGSLPASSAAPQSGAFTVTGTNPFDSQKLAYDALSKVAGKVAAKVAVTGPVLVYDQTEINSLVNYKSVLKVLTAVQTEVRQLKGTFSNQMDPEAQTLLRLPAANAAPGGAKNFAGILAPGLALGGLKTLSDLIGMFRTNTSIAFSTFTSDDVALAAAVTEALIAKNASVYQPAVMPLDATDNASAFMDLLSQVQSDLVNLQNDATTDQSKVQQVSDALGAFIQADQALQANTDQTKAAGLTSAREVARVFALGLLGGTAAAALDAPTANIWKAQRDQFLKELATLVSSVTTMTTSFGTLQTSLTAVTNTGSATLTAILRAEKLMAKATTANASILLVKTSVLGGSVVTRTNLFSGGHLLYTGGAIVNFTIFGATGLVTASGVVVGDTETKKTDF